MKERETEEGEKGRKENGEKGTRGRWGEDSSEEERGRSLPACRLARDGSDGHLASIGPA